MYSIIGSGIAGLACSYTLSSFGVNNEIFEREDLQTANNYGIQLSPNASYALEKIGLLSKLESKMKVINTIEVYSLNNLRKLTTLPINEFIVKNNLTKYYTASRDVLHRELLSNVTSCKTKIKYGSKIKSVADFGDKIKITEKNEHTSICDKLIIANGNTGSPLFNRISRSPISNDFKTHRSATKISKFPFKLAKDTIYIFFGSGIHIVIYPYFEDLVNIVMIKKDNIDKAILENQRNIEKSITNFLNDLQWNSWPLYDSRIKLNLDTRRPIFAIGDTAHSIKPHLAQGASMALEDAYTLGRMIGERNTIEAVHLAMDNRKERINRVIRNSNLNRQIFHASPIISIFRDFYLKKTDGYGQLNNLKWLYGHKV
tara:strand:- start:235 stop:1350 length:1116 start_codon:yes stop_codon:yes gene_type:complete